jgi:HAD superfamily hydrolase (TIGR01662 family)
VSAIRAVLFDVGGPIDTEVRHEELIDACIRGALAACGVRVTDASYADACRAAVDSFAPDAYAAIAWRLAGGERATVERVLAEVAGSWQERRAARGGLELRPGIADLLRELRAGGVVLGLAANQPAAALEDLDRAGIGGLFAHREVSGHHGYRKPDVRVFLRACEQLGVTPGECAMVGDRIDNDIAPANALGMATVLFRTGRHMAQQPRAPGDVPDVEVASVAGLRAALAGLLGVPLTP